MERCRRTRVWSMSISPGAIAIALLVTAPLVTAPLAAQVCLASTEASPGWIALAYGRAAKDASVTAIDAGWQFSRTLAVFGDANVTAYPKPDPQRNRLAIGAAYTFARSERFGACITPGVEDERIGDLHVLRVPVGVSLGWTTTFDTGQRRLGFQVEPFFVYSREMIAQFSHTSRFVSGRVAVVFGVRRLFVGLQHEQAFDGDARWHTLGRIGFAFK